MADHVTHKSIVARTAAPSIPGVAESFEVNFPDRLLVEFGIVAEVIFVICHQVVTITIHYCF